MKKCPYCNGTSGYYLKKSINGIGLVYKEFDGREDDDLDIMRVMVENNTPYCYCQNCLRRLIQ